MEQLNHSLFLLINADLNTPQWMLHIAKFLANDLVFLTLLILVVMSIRPAWRSAAFKTAAAIGCAMMAAKLIGLTFPLPRPFVAGIGHTFIPHASSPSFPSSHGTFIFTFAVAMLLWVRVWAGVAMMAVALLVAWSRVYLGVHFPLDMAGGLLVGGFSCLIIDRIYEFMPSSWKQVAVFRTHTHPDMANILCLDPVPPPPDNRNRQ